MIGSNPKRQATIVVDLGFGDCGKGSIVDFLCRRRPVQTVIRFHGGGQAGHNVVTADGRHHTFSQFGSGTFVPGVRTYLSRHMIVSPLAMFTEEEHLRSVGISDAFSRTAISDRALVVTPFQWAANRLRELARTLDAGEGGRHGSCGMGIGETTYDHLRLGGESVFVGDLAGSRALLERKLHRLREFKLADIADVIDRCRGLKEAETELDLLLLEPERAIGEITTWFNRLPRFIRVVDDAYLRQLLAEDGQIVFEGAQGVLLDQDHGFHPYTTWSRCTPVNALELLAENGYDGQVEKLGLVRAYATRHGPGPFPTESPFLTRTIPDGHNRLDPWQRNFRIGWFDLVSTRYAIAACGGVDALAVSCLDRLKGLNRWLVCDAYHWPSSAQTEAARLLDHRHPLLQLASDIKTVPGIGDRPYQQAITDLLLRANPDYEVCASGDDFPAKCRTILERIATGTGRPVTITSCGPTAEDKKPIA